MRYKDITSFGPLLGVALCDALSRKVLGYGLCVDISWMTPFVSVERLRGVLVCFSVETNSDTSPAIFANLGFTPYEIFAHWLPSLTTIAGTFGIFTFVIVVDVAVDALAAVTVAVVTVAAASWEVGGDFLDFVFFFLLGSISLFSSSMTSVKEIMSCILCLACC